MFYRSLASSTYLKLKARGSRYVCLPCIPLTFLSSVWSDLSMWGHLTIKFLGPHTWIVIGENPDGSLIFFFTCLPSAPMHRDVLKRAIKHSSLLLIFSSSHHGIDINWELILQNSFYTLNASTINVGYFLWNMNLDATNLDCLFLFERKSNIWGW